MEFTHAALTEPAGTAFHALNIAEDAHKRYIYKMFTYLL